MDVKTFNSIIGELTKELFSKKNISEIVVKYIKIVSKGVNAISGAVYLKDGDYLKLCGSYAFSSEDVKFKFGEGIVGEVALSCEPVEIKDIDNLEIKSTLEIFAKGSIYAFPISFEKELLGVVEVVKGAEFSEVQKNLLDVSGELLALSILNSERLNHIQKQYEQIEFQNSELKKQKREIELQNSIISKEMQRLQQSNRYKSEFLANMSHELRTPLNSIIILSRLLSTNREKNLNKTQVKHLNIIHKSANDLLELINDILDLSKLEARLMSVNLQKFNIKDLLLELYESFLPIANSKGLKLKLELKDLKVVEVFSDYKKIKQILKNFLSNALKFTEDGSIVIGFKEYGESFEVFVKDSGIGIAKENLEKIFEPFKQADSGIDRKYGGTGLGLSISKEFAHLLGGKIGVKSKEGVGSEFYLQLPKEIEPKELRGADVEIVDTREGRVKRVKKLRKILVVTGSKDVKFEIEKEFADLNFEIVFLPIDLEIFSKMKRDFDLIILNIDFRKEDLELVKSVKNYAKDVPIIIYSSSELSSEEIFLLKGFSNEIIMEGRDSIYRLKEEVLLIVNRAKKVDKDESIEALKGEYSELEGKKVLIVDDDGINLFSISMLLDEVGVKSIVAENGDEALKKLENNLVDLILMDLMMPKKDGIETIKEIKEKERLKDIPIIVLTAKRDDVDRKRALKVGADEFMSKPLEQNRLFKAMVRLLK